MADEGRPAVVDIYQNEEFFRESALLNSPRRDEHVVAIENTKVLIPIRGYFARDRDALHESVSPARLPALSPQGYFRTSRCAEGLVPTKRGIKRNMTLGAGRPAGSCGGGTPSAFAWEFAPDAGRKNRPNE
jgi:hypothetical protein